MPFKSEKQRRFLWAQHPDIAKRWADEYPGQKDLPQYAHKKKPTDKEKAAAMTELNRQYSVNTVGLRIYSECVKKANSGLLHVEIPHSDKPVAAGDEHVTAKNQGEDKALPVQTRDGNEVNQSREDLAGDLVNNGSHPLLKKLAVVLSQPIMQAIENEKAEQQARMAAKMPQNAGIKRYAMPASTTPLPMGMQQPAQPAPTPAQQPAQPQQQGTGMNSPSANPINSFGALSTAGNINGNAAFGTKNSPDSSKSAAANTPCSCGCGSTVATCKCGPSCSCRKPGGSCCKTEKASASQLAKVAMLSKQAWAEIDSVEEFASKAAELAVARKS